jgi:hypothetical protein
VPSQISIRWRQGSAGRKAPAEPGASVRVLTVAHLDNIDDAHHNREGWRLYPRLATRRCEGKETESQLDAEGSKPLSPSLATGSVRPAGKGIRASTNSEAGARRCSSRAPAPKTMFGYAQARSQIPTSGQLLTSGRSKKKTPRSKAAVDPCQKRHDLHKGIEALCPPAVLQQK